MIPHRFCPSKVSNRIVVYGLVYTTIIFYNYYKCRFALACTRALNTGLFIGVYAVWNGFSIVYP